VRKIPLTQGQVALVNDEDYDKLINYKWRAVRGRSTWYAVRTATKDVNGSRKTVYMHRALLGQVDQVDHKDGDGLNNQRQNLRAATHTQNQRNRIHKRVGSSRFHGVYWHKAARKWAAQITAPTPRYLGLFEDELAAAKAYDAAARELYGAFAALNLPGEGSDDQT